MKERLARLLVRAEDTRDSLGSRGQVLQMYGRVAAPTVLWVATLFGAFWVLVATDSVPGSADRWLVALFAWSVLLAFTGPTMGRDGGQPLPGAGPRGYVWLAVSVWVTANAVRQAGLAVGQVLGCIAVLAGVAALAWLSDRRKTQKRLEDEQGPRKALLGFGIAAGATALVAKSESEFGYAILAIIWIGIPWLAWTTLHDFTGLSFWPMFIVFVAGNVLGSRLANWFPPGAGEARAKRAGRTTMRQHLEQARSGGGSTAAVAARTADGVRGAGDRGTGMPELGDIEGAWTWLARQGVPLAKGIFTGRVEYPDGRLGEWATAKPHLLGIGAPGSGKSSTILGQNVMAHMGIAIVSSSKGDLAEQTAAFRSLLGDTLFWDPTGKSVTPAYCTPLRWSPVMGIYTRDDAVWAAKQLVDASAVQAGASSDSAEHFKQRAAMVLAPLLYAGMLAGKKISKVVEWVEVGPTGWEEPLTLLGADGQERFVRQLGAFIESSGGDGGRENHSVLTTVGNLFAPYATDRALREADDADFDPQSWLRTHQGWGTIYVVTTAGSEARAMGPLVALMMSQIIEARRRTYSDEDSAILLAMDEIANAPLPGLASFVSNDRAFGVGVCAMTQTDEQIIENPVYGSSLLSGFGEKVVFPDSGSPRLHEHVENSTRKGSVWLGNMGEGSAKAGIESMIRSAVGGIGSVPGTTTSQGASQHEARVLDRAEVAGGLVRGQARFLTGYRALTRMVPVLQPDGGEMEEERALPVRLLPPIDRSGPFKALTEWAENSHAWREYDATQPAGGEVLTQD